MRTIMTIDDTLSLMQEGYTYIKKRCDKFQTDLFQTRLLGEKVICMTGTEATRIFYDATKFERKGAAPKRVQKTLLGENAIQGMDGEAHLHRKHFFMSLLDKPNQERLAGLVAKKWMESASTWKKAGKVVLFDEAKNILCQVACQWAGVPLSEKEAASRADDFIAMIYGFGALGQQYWKGKKARTRCEEWMQGMITSVHLGTLDAKPETVLHAMAFYEDAYGNKLDRRMAAIELINVIRPIVAISTYIAFMALALHKHLEWKTVLRHGDPEDFELFVQEVRRFYPFTPFVGARVKQDFTWNQSHFAKGTLVLLDVFGTNHDARVWENPFAFRPERFREKNVSLFEFIPHGGGDPAAGHRCPGEGVTVEVMKASLDFLVNKIEYVLPEQDLRCRLDKIPTLPNSKIILADVHIQESCR